jgi:hypothetical protein
VARLAGSSGGRMRYVLRAMRHQRHFRRGGSDGSSNPYDILCRSEDLSGFSSWLPSWERGKTSYVPVKILYDRLLFSVFIARPVDDVIVCRSLQL